MKIRLRQVRERRLLSQRELAERAGVAQTTISAIELGKQEARISTVRKLAEALNAEPDELIDIEAVRADWDAARRAAPEQEADNGG